MKKTVSSLVTFAVSCTFFCTTAAAQSLDSFNVKDQDKWNCAKTISIMFPVEGEFKGNNDLSFYQNTFASKLAMGLKKIPGVEKVDVVYEKTNLTSDIVIEGKFIDLTTGSRALRFWIGFGAGKSFCRAEINGTDPKSGAQIFFLDHARGSAIDFVNDDELIENIDEVVEDVSAGLLASRGACHSKEAASNLNSIN